MIAPSLSLPQSLIDKIINNAMMEDIGSIGDVTTNIICESGSRIRADIVARKPGTISGLDIAARVFKLLDPLIEITFGANDSDVVDCITPLICLNGDAKSILIGERTALNFLGLMSGVATETKSLVEAISHTNAKVSCTRKTIPGLRALQKYAVRCGGGVNHRFGLSDGILIKDNHIIAANGLGNAIKRAKTYSSHLHKIEVEIDSLEQIEIALDSGADVIMLDNMSNHDLEEAVRIVNGQALLEASGSVNLDNIVAIAETGVDIISVGWITHSFSSLDVALDFDFR